MIKFIDHYFQYSDERGSLLGLINQGNWEEINLITSQQDVIRGNHYHKDTIELFIILDGEIEVTVNLIDSQLSETYTVHGGDVFIIEPMVNHTFNVKKDSQWLNALNKKTNQEHPDIHRIQKES
jgi:mannose-6-phosphate isomerase-like protein (cupin superfamily)